MNDPSFSERRETADKAKRALLEKFRSKAAAPDPALAAERAEQARARETKRAAAEEKRKARIVAEKAARIAAAEAQAVEVVAQAKRQGEAAEAERLTAIERAEILAFEQKAARDLRYAARKARK